MIIKALEAIVFRLRIIILAALAVITVWTGYHALQLGLDAGFDKQLPSGHEYVETFQEYRDQLFGSNRVIIVLRAREGDIWNQPFLSKLKIVTDDIFFLPGIDRRTVTSLWTPNTRYFEITEEGFRADDVIPGTVTPDTMTEDEIEGIQNNVIRGGYVGRLVANDFTAAMVVAELTEIDPRTQEPLDYFELARQLEERIRGVHEDENYEIHIIGFAKMIGDIADGAGTVVQFFIIAFLLTTLCVFWYSRSLILTFAAVFSSFVSLIWQFGLLNLLGYGLDPLAILVPFLVYAIGVSHAVQQINLISKKISDGLNSEQAARASFSGLLIPGSMALVTDLVGFGTLYFIPIPMVQELAIVASIGVALKIVTNLIMLPLVVSYFKFDEGYIRRVTKARDFRLKIMKGFGFLAIPKVAYVVLTGTTIMFVYAIIQSQDRHIGDLHPGSPELRPDARYNIDSQVISEKFSIGLDLLTIIIETPSEACIKYPYMDYINQFSWYMQNVPGVLSVHSIAFAAKLTNAGWNEGNLKFRALPRNQFSLVQATASVPTSSGLLNAQCTLLPLQIFTTDSRAETITTVIDAVKTWRDANVIPPALTAGTDNKDGTWRVPRRAFDNLTFHPQLQWDERYSFPVEVVRVRESVDEETGERIRTEESEIIGTIDVEVDEEGSPVPIDIRAVLDGAGASDAQAVVLHDLPTSTYVRLASGNVGVTAAINEMVHESELPMLLLVYAIIIIMVMGTYRDWRATVACCVPLTMATFFGYWFMKEIEIGLKVATLPVMVLAVGLGVDYAFYIYNRVQYHLSEGLNITKAYQQSMLETGMAVVFVAITLAIGVSTWTFSDLKFQADMGALLTFMFMINMVMAVTALPAIAVVLDRLFPRTKPVRPVPGAMAH
jgi:predicted RND superfamily exporter protein